MTKPQSYIEVRLDDSAIAGQLASLQKKFSTSFTEIASAISIARQAIDAVVGITAKFIEAGLDVERIETKAAASMRRYGVDAAATVESLKSYNAALQNKLGLDGDALLAMQGMLASIGVAPDKLRVATQAAIGLSQTLGQDLDSAAKIVAKTLGGNSSALEKMGIHTDSATEAMGKMLEMYRDSLGASESAAVKQAALGEAIGDVTEAIGLAIVKSKPYADAITAMQVVTEKLLGGESTSTSTIDRWWSAWSTGIADFTDKALALSRSMRGDLDRMFSLGGLFGETDKPGPTTSTPPAQGSDTDQTAPLPAPEIRDKKDEEKEKAAKTARERAAARRREEAQRNEEALLRHMRQSEARSEDIKRAQRQAERQAQEQHDKDVEAAKSAHIDRMSDLDYEAAEQRAAIMEEQENRMQRFTDSMVGLGFQSMAGYIDAMIQGAARGEDAGKVTADFLGGILKQIGQAMIAMGTATAAFAAATLPAPVAWAGSGGVAGIGAGVAMAAVGTALVAGGSLIGAFAGSGQSSSTGAKAADSAIKANRRAIDQSMGGLSGAGASSGAGTTVINIEFNRPVGNPRRTAREIADILRARGGHAVEGIGAG